MSETTKSGSISKKRWAQYVAAGSAGVAATLGAQDSAEAAITVVDLNTLIVDSNSSDTLFTGFGPYGFGASGAGFSFLQAVTATSGDGVLAALGSGNFAFAGFASGAYFYPFNLAYGAPISAQSFGVPASERGDMAFFGGYSNSQWLAPGVGYVGFTFDLGAGTQYGWAELDVAGAPINTGTFIRYAYAGPGESLFAGQTAVPEPSSLAALALGAAGILAWRKKRSLASAA